MSSITKTNSIKSKTEPDASHNVYSQSTERTSQCFPYPQSARIAAEASQSTAASYSNYKTKIQKSQRKHQINNKILRIRNKKKLNQAKELERTRWRGDRRRVSCERWGGRNSVDSGGDNDD